MVNEQIYKKGDRVWVQTPVERGEPERRPALILSVVLPAVYFDCKTHFAIRYLDKEGTAAYQCIPEYWIVGHVDKEQANDFQYHITNL